MKILEICNEIIKYNISIVCFKIHFPDQSSIVIDSQLDFTKKKQQSNGTTEPISTTTTTQNVPKKKQQIKLVLENIYQELNSNKLFQIMIKESYKKIPSQYEREYKKLFTLIFDFRGNKKLTNSLLIDFFFLKIKTAIKNVQNSRKKIFSDYYNIVSEKIKRREEFINCNE